MKIYVCLSLPFFEYNKELCVNFIISLTCFLFHFIPIKSFSYTLSSPLKGSNCTFLSFCTLEFD